MSGQSVVSTFANALTAQAQLDLWTLGWLGQGSPPPDTAALILLPTNLLGGPVLSSLTLGDLTLDPKTYAPMSGLIQVAAAGTTGLIVASWSVTLTATPKTQPSGMALFNAGSGHLWYVSAFDTWPQAAGGLVVWNAKVTLNSPCQGN